MTISYSPTYYHLKLVPMRYHVSSGLSRVHFHVRKVWHSYYEFIRHPNGGAMPIPPAAFCTLHTSSGQKLYLLIDRSSFPKLSQAILLLSETYSTGNRAQRYLTLFKVYECLEKEPDLMLSAVRHGLSHAPSALSRPKTVAALKSLFGTTSIDLSQTTHCRVFYSQLVKLLVIVDSALTSALIDILPQLHKIESEDVPLLKWRVIGMEGFCLPMNINTESINLVMNNKQV